MTNKYIWTVMIIWCICCTIAFIELYYTIIILLLFCIVSVIISHLFLFESYTITHSNTTAKIWLNTWGNLYKGTHSIYMWAGLCPVFVKSNFSCLIHLGFGEKLWHSIAYWKHSKISKLLWHTNINTFLVILVELSTCTCEANKRRTFSYKNYFT